MVVNYQIVEISQKYYALRFYELRNNALMCSNCKECFSILVSLFLFFYRSLLYMQRKSFIAVKFIFGTNFIAHTHTYKCIYIFVYIYIFVCIYIFCITSVPSKFYCFCNLHNGLSKFFCLFYFMKVISFQFKVYEFIVSNAGNQTFNSIDFCVL